MTTPPERPGAVALDDPGRLAALLATNLLDTEPEPSFDQITRLATRLTNAPIALMSLVTADRQFFRSAAGLPPELEGTRETPLSHSFCQYVVTSNGPLRVVDAREDPLVRDNLAIPDLGVIAYLGVPLRMADGHVLGALCAIDGEPHAWRDDDREVLEDLAAIAVREIEHRMAERMRAQPQPARFARLINLLPVGLYICDGYGHLVFYNDRAAALWGFAPSLPTNEAVAFGVRPLLRGDGSHLEALDLPATTVMRDRQTMTNREFRVEPGRSVQVSAGPSIGPEDQLLGAVVVLQDVTEVRRATRLRDDLLSLVSHELRTPLTVINGMARALERRIPAEGEPESRMAVSDIILAGQRMERVVENMLLLSRLEHESTVPEPVLVTKAVGAALERHRRDFPRTEVDVQVPDRALTVDAVPSWLQLILVNLLNNAEQYGDGHKPHSLLAVAIDGEVELSICNSGEPLEEEEYGAWFEPFYRGAATSAVIAGAGLGLTVAWRLAEAQSGSLKATPWLNGRGTMVSLKLPRPVAG